MTPGMQTRKISRAKGLTELKTVITRHIAAKPPRKGTTYLDLFVLSMEKQRLEQELAGIEHRRKRILERIAEVKVAMEKAVEAGRQEKPVSGEQAASSQQPGGRRWKKIPVEY